MTLPRSMMSVKFPGITKEEEFQRARQQQRRAKNRRWGLAMARGDQVEADRIAADMAEPKGC